MNLKESNSLVKCSILSFTCLLFLHFPEYVNHSYLFLCYFKNLDQKWVYFYSVLLCWLWILRSWIFLVSSKFWLNVLFMMHRRTVVYQRRFPPFSVMQIEWGGDYLNLVRDWTWLGLISVFLRQLLVCSYS